MCEGAISDWKFAEKPAINSGFGRLALAATRHRTHFAPFPRLNPIENALRNARLIASREIRAVSSAVRASGLHPEGQRFKSFIAHHTLLHLRVYHVPITICLCRTRPQQRHKNFLQGQIFGDIPCNARPSSSLKLFLSPRLRAADTAIDAKVNFRRILVSSRIEYIQLEDCAPILPGSDKGIGEFSLPRKSPTLLLDPAFSFSRPKMKRLRTISRSKASGPEPGKQ